MEAQGREGQKEPPVVLFAVRGRTEPPRGHLPVLGLPSHKLHHAAHRDHCGERKLWVTWRAPFLGGIVWATTAIASPLTGKGMG